MSASRVDVIVIGGGLNGLVAGAVLARGGLSVTVLEARDAAGGAAVTTEFAPGLRGPGLSHALGPVHPEVVRALQLDRSGLEWIAPDPALTIFGQGGRTLVLHRDPVIAAGAIAARSSSDAPRWTEFVKASARLAGLLREVAGHRPPSLDDLPIADWWRLAAVGRRARALGRTDLTHLARWTPMAVADLVGEWFEDDLVQAAISAHAIFGNPVGPWSAGTGGMWLQRLGLDDSPVGGGATVRGGPGALTQAVTAALRQAKGALRTNARVVRIDVRDGRATGVVLEGGDHLPASAVVSAIGVKRTIGSLVDPVELPPSYRQRIKHIRARGVTSKINLALAAAPVFPDLGGDAVPLKGRLLVAPDVDYLERAFDATKYGRISDRPWLEVAIPTMSDWSLGSDGRHVMSVYVHATPRHLRDGAWSEERSTVLSRALDVLSAHAPALASLIEHAEVITPEDLEVRWGLDGGHIFHGEPALDQSWVARPILGWARYATPIEGLYLAGGGTHPAGGLTGLPGLLGAREVQRAMRRRPIRGLRVRLPRT
jgi:phytoene dehydrogenase-like protein